MSDFSRYPTLAYAHEWSVKTLAEMENLLASMGETNPDVLVVAPSGSLGRLEGMAHSDCDLIVLITDDAAMDKERAKAAMEEVWRKLQPLGLPMPKSSGIYATAASPEQICDHSTLGQVADDKNIFGKRLQILLDTLPVYGHERFRDLRRQLLDRYAAGFLIYDQRREWVYLLNDLLRYLRSYCSWHQFDLSSDPIDSWYMRNAKLRNGRIPMFAGLIFLLGECSKEKEDKIGWLDRHLDLTMMQRLRYVYEQNEDPNIDRILGAYEYFMMKMNDDRTREILIKTTPKSLEELYSRRLPEYDDLHRNSGTIIGELTRFILDRRGQWSDAFFEYLLL